MRGTHRLSHISKPNAPRRVPSSVNLAARRRLSRSRRASIPRRPPILSHPLAPAPSTSHERDTAQLLLVIGRGTPVTGDSVLARSGSADTTGMPHPRWNDMNAASIAVRAAVRSDGPVLACRSPPYRSDKPSGWRLNDMAGTSTPHTRKAGTSHQSRQCVRGAGTPGARAEPARAPGPRPRRPGRPGPLPNSATIGA